jgi:DHA1 family tetracycline resistance protein-like MFS transporter
MMGIGILIPVIPALVGEFTDSMESQTYWYGALTFTFGFTQFLCAPMLGALSDRFGRRLVLLLSIGGLGTMFALSAVVTSLHALLATRIIGGALASNISVANAYVADITKPEDRTKSFGQIGAAFGAGFILGPMIGGLVGGIGIRVPFMIASGLAILNFAYGLFVLPESLAPEKRKPIDFRKANPFGALVGLTRLKGVGMLVTVIGLSNLAQFVMHGTWVLFMTFRFGWGTRENGMSMFAVGVMSAFVQGFLLSKLLRVLGERKLVVAGLASGVIVFAGYGLAMQSWMVYALIGANFLAFCVTSAVNALVSKAADAREQGLAMGSLSSLNSLVAVLAPLLATPIFAHVSHFPRNDLRTGATFFLSSFLTLLALLCALWHFGREKAREGSGVEA